MRARTAEHSERVYRELDLDLERIALLKEGEVI